MADEPHDVVKLLLARMESHPEEFRIGDGPVHQRWVHHVDMVHDHGSNADKAALNAKLRDIIMDEVHEQVMDELLNGPDRRRKEAEDREYERHLAKALQHTKQQGIVGKSLHQTWLDDYVYNGSITAAQPEPTPPKPLTDKIKQKLGIKK